MVEVWVCGGVGGNGRWKLTDRKNDMAIWRHHHQKCGKAAAATDSLLQMFCTTLHHSAFFLHLKIGNRVCKLFQSASMHFESRMSYESLFWIHKILGKMCRKCRFWTLTFNVIWKNTGRFRVLAFFSNWNKVFREYYLFGVVTLLIIISNALPSKWCKHHIALFICSACKGLTTACKFSEFLRRLHNNQTDLNRSFKSQSNAVKD